jgi:DNA-binding response OmpR family regulator
MTATDLAMPALGGAKVLVVEGREDDAVSLTAVLRLKGFNARTARTGADALSRVSADRPHAVVLDPDLPDADGCEVIRRVRSAPDPPPVVVLSGHTAPSVRRAASAAGAAAFVLKPADPDKLVRLLDLLIARG